MMRTFDRYTRETLGLNAFGIDGGEPELSWSTLEYTSYDGVTVFFSVDSRHFMAITDDYIDIMHVTNAIASVKNDVYGVREIKLLKPVQSDDMQDEYCGRSKYYSFLYIAEIFYENKE